MYKNKVTFLAHFKYQNLFVDRGPNHDLEVSIAVYDLKINIVLFIRLQISVNVYRLLCY